MFSWASTTDVPNQLVKTKQQGRATKQRIESCQAAEETIFEPIGSKGLDEILKLLCAHAWVGVCVETCRKHLEMLREPKSGPEPRVWLSIQLAGIRMKEGNAIWGSMLHVCPQVDAVSTSAKEAKSALRKAWGKLKGEFNVWPGSIISSAVPRCPSQCVRTLVLA